MPPFLFHYIDGGSQAEQTLRRYVTDFEAVALRQRVLRKADDISLATRLFDETLDLPVVTDKLSRHDARRIHGEMTSCTSAPF